MLAILTIWLRLISCQCLELNQNSNSPTHSWLIYGSGIRLMEWICLRIQNIDLGQGQLFVRGGWNRRPNWASLRCWQIYFTGIDCVDLDAIPLSYHRGDNIVLYLTAKLFQSCYSHFSFFGLYKYMVVIISGYHVCADAFLCQLT